MSSMATMGGARKRPVLDRKDSMPVSVTLRGFNRSIHPLPVKDDKSATQWLGREIAAKPSAEAFAGLPGSALPATSRKKANRPQTGVPELRGWDQPSLSSHSLRSTTTPNLGKWVSESGTSATRTPDRGLDEAEVVRSHLKLSAGKDKELMSLMKQIHSEMRDRGVQGKWLQ
jgi:hypothetical protein